MLKQSPIWAHNLFGSGERGAMFCVFIKCFMVLWQAAKSKHKGKEKNFNMGWGKGNQDCCQKA